MMEKKQISGIDYFEVNPNSRRGTVVVLHGYGADFSDLAPMANALDLDQDFRWLFPNGIESVPFGGRAWFPISEERLVAASVQGKGFDFAAVEPVGLSEAAEQIKAFVSELQLTDFFLGGFSQGSMVALKAAVEIHTNLRGLVLLSSTVSKDIIEDLQDFSFDQLPIFQSHGEADPVLPYQYAEDLRELIYESSGDLRFFDFPGGHEIPPDILMELRNFLFDFSC